MSVLLFWTLDEEVGSGDTRQAAATVSATGGQLSPPVPLQSISGFASYLYQEYADDFDLWAFVNSYNSIVQTYLDWFNQTPLSVYISPNISGQLLDWIMAGIYGIDRPVFSSLVTQYRAGLNAFPLNAIPLNGKKVFRSGTATPATDDYYKRVGTWILYIGDGGAFTIPLLRNRVARFLYGVDGTNATLDQAQTVHIIAGPIDAPGDPALSSVAGGSIGARGYGVVNTYITPEGETNGSPGAKLSVASDHLLVVDSPAAEVGATGWNTYVRVLPSAQFRAGLNSMPLNGYALNGSNVPPMSLPTRQNGFPIPIGTNWTEPTSGWVYGPALPKVNTSNPDTNFIIVVPSGQSSTLFQQALEQGILPLPFTLSATAVSE